MSIKIIQEELISQHNQKHRYTQNSQSTSNHQLSSQQLSTSSNSILAVKKLKEKQDALDSLKRRLSVLKIHEQKSLNKYKANKKKMEDHQYSRSLVEEDQMLKQKYMRQLQESLSLSKNFNIHQRKVRKERLQGVRQQIYQMKHSQYKDLRQMSDFIDRNIKQKKYQDLSRKIEKRNSIVTFEEKHRQHFQKYVQSKRMENSSQKSREVEKLRQKANQRDKQIERLSKIQTELLERQSRSQMIANQSSSKFMKMVMNPQTLEQQNKNKNKSKSKSKNSKKSKGVAPQVVRNQYHQILQKQ